MQAAVAEQLARSGGSLLAFKQVQALQVFVQQVQTLLLAIRRLLEPSFLICRSYSCSLFFHIPDTSKTLAPVKPCKQTEIHVSRRTGCLPDRAMQSWTGSQVLTDRHSAAGNILALPLSQTQSHQTVSHNLSKTKAASISDSNADTKTSSAKALS